MQNFFFMNILLLGQFENICWSIWSETKHVITSIINNRITSKKKSNPIKWFKIQFPHLFPYIQILNELKNVACESIFNQFRLKNWTNLWEKRKKEREKCTIFVKIMYLCYTLHKSFQHFLRQHELKPNL